MSRTYKRSDETRAKISAAKKAAWADPAARAKMSATSKAALADPAVRAKISAAKKAAWADPAVRAKISAARKAALADPAVRAKMSAARKAAWAQRYPELATLNDDQLQVYRLLRRKGCAHEGALGEARRDRHKYPRVA